MMPPSRLLISGICECYFLRPEGNFAGMTELRLLRWGDYSKSSSRTLKVVTVSSGSGRPHQRCQGKDRGRDWSEAAASPGILSAARRWRGQGADNPRGLWRGVAWLTLSFQISNPDFRLWASRTEREYISVLRHQVCYRICKR